MQYHERVGMEYETLQNKLVVNDDGYFAGARIGQPVSSKHAHIAKLIRYSQRAEYGWKRPTPRKKYRIYS